MIANINKYPMAELIPNNKAVANLAELARRLGVRRGALTGGGCWEGLETAMALNRMRRSSKYW
jgi:hypothetical protein